MTMTLNRARDMKKLMGLCVFVASVISGPVVFAQSSDGLERIATRAEVGGDWVMVPMSDALEPTILPKNPWPDACQWYVYFPRGPLKSITVAQRPCPILTADRLEQTVAAAPPVVSWKYDQSPTDQKGMIVVSRSDAKDYAEYWVPHIVTADFSKGDALFLKGDLVLYLVNLDAKPSQVTWIRHLRKLP